MGLKARLRETAIGKKVIWPILSKIKVWEKRRSCVSQEKAIARQGMRSERHIFYCGVCESSNMGDMAQTYCTLRWLQKNFPDYEVIVCNTSVFMEPKCHLVDTIRSMAKADDFIVFQSGYNTHDLGGNEDLMHQTVISAFPDMQILMLPQTVYFRSEARKKQCATVYNAHKKMLFLARDPVSYESAREMFPDLCVRLFPDIVTSLIGYFDGETQRKRIYLCRRKDVEQFYTEEDLAAFERALRNVDSDVDVSDTILSASNKEIFADLEGFVQRIVKRFSEYRLVVTDKYHGLIFSLVANTPVIVLKTKDHKVTSGYEWFQKIYPDRVFYADSVEECEILAREILKSPSYTALDPYFDREYYSKLFDAWNKWRTDHENM